MPKMTPEDFLNLVIGKCFVADVTISKNKNPQYSDQNGIINWYPANHETRDGTPAGQGKGQSTHASGPSSKPARTAFLP
jgi:hypothetical protein